MIYLSRTDWGHSAPLGPAMSLPVQGVHLHHSVTLVTADPVADMKRIEQVGIQRFGRFPYSYAIHPSGVILEGAGTHVGAHTAGYNSTSFGIVLIGNYEQVLPTDAQIQAFGELIAVLRFFGAIPENAYLAAHRHRKATACPGAQTMARWADFQAAFVNPPTVTSPQEVSAVDMAVTSSGNGYWIVSSNGGVFAFGDAPFHGSLPGLGVTPNAPIVAIVPTPDDGGYRLLGADGGVFCFGNATFHGSATPYI